MRYTTIIQAQQLAQHLQDADWLVIDCRFNLANTQYGIQAYQQGHIAGAHYLHLDEDLSSPITPSSGRHPLPDVAKLQAKLQQIGLNQVTQVVVYDDMAGAMAARAWWLLRWMGHEAVAVLEGGFPAWQKPQYPVSNQLPVVAQGNFVAKLQDNFIVTTADILAAPDAIQLVDARAAERFCGKVEPIDPVAGHIPGAINRPLGDNLEQGYFKSPAQLQQEWLQLLQSGNQQPVVHMCGSGVTACFNQLAMELAGLSGSRIYAGSWSEWIRDPQRAVATA